MHGSSGEIDFEQAIEDALDSLPADLREFMSNVAIVVEEEPPAGRPLLGLYQGLPLT
jgi:predicted Zn-dependent protease with MMP-like domain